MANTSLNHRAEVHGPSDFSEGPLRRLRQACDRCRARKIKCDLRRPSCANCENRSFICEFSTQQRKRGPKPLGKGVDHVGQFCSVPSPHVRRSSSPIRPCLHDGDHRSNGYTSSGFTDSSCISQRPGISYTEVTQDSVQSPSSSPHETANHAPQSVFSKSSTFSTIYDDLEAAVGSLGLDLPMPSLARRCVDHFFDCLYPLMPIVYRPKIELGICLLQPGIERRDSDIPVFTLTASLCAIAAAIIPSTIFRQGSLIADSFYQASKRSLNLYRAKDLEHPDSVSIAIRYFQSGYIHSTGIRRTSWDDLEEAIRLAQAMALHDEASYSNKDYVESQLCRRLFWILFSGDKSAGILGGRRISLGRYFVQGGITVQYSKNLDGEDQILSPFQDLDEPVPTVVTGFNFCQDIWRGAYFVLLEIEILRDRYISQEQGEEQPSRIPSPAELSRLVDLHLAFETSLDNLPRCLRAYPTLSLSSSNFHFGQKTDEASLPRALAIQRTNLHVTFQCLRLVIVQALSAFMDFGSPLWTPTTPVWLNLSSANTRIHSPSSGQYLQSTHVAELDPVLTRNVTNFLAHDSESPALLFQKIGIAKDMLYIVHSSTLENLRLNGESCVEKIRLVGAAMLELIDHHSDSPLASTARQFRDLYPHILAHLESKASDSLLKDT